LLGRALNVPIDPALAPAERLDTLEWRSASAGPKQA
jgi:hypothetical protein